MSTPAADLATEDNRPSDSLSGLLAEYTVKLQNIVSDVDNLEAKFAEFRSRTPPSDKREWLALKRLIGSILPVAKALSQLVSQMIEQSPADDVLSLELRLRLAEFESAIFACQQIQTLSLPG